MFKYHIEFFFFSWLFKIMICLYIKASLHIFGITAYKNDLHIIVGYEAYLFCENEAIYDRHFHIKEDDVEGSGMVISLHKFPCIRKNTDGNLNCGKVFQIL